MNELLKEEMVQCTNGMREEFREETQKERGKGRRKD